MYYFIGILYIVVGIIVKHFKWYFLISGYNTMPAEEKKKYNIVALATLFRNVFVFGGIILLAINWFFSVWGWEDYLEGVSVFVNLMIVIILIGRANSGKYGKKTAIILVKDLWLLILQSIHILS